MFTKISNLTFRFVVGYDDQLRHFKLILNGLYMLYFVFIADLSNDMLQNIYDAFLTGLKEYTQDNRGDIGAWMRESSMTSLQTITLLLNKLHPEFLTPELLTRVMTGIAQQAVEKIDRTRALAGKIFYSLVHR